MAKWGEYQTSLFIVPSFPLRFLSSLLMSTHPPLPLIPPLLLSCLITSYSLFSHLYLVSYLYLSFSPCHCQSYPHILYLTSFLSVLPVSSCISLFNSFYHVFVHDSLIVSPPSPSIFKDRPPGIRRPGLLLLCCPYKNNNKYSNIIDFILIYQVETYENQDYQEFIVCHMDCCVLTLVFC